MFARARASSPCIIFFDELDAMVPRRDDSLVRPSSLPPHHLSFPRPSSAIHDDLENRADILVLRTQSESSARVVNTLLTELDGLEPRKQVFVIGATNRPDILDPAMVRPGRLDKLIYIDLPNAEERLEILKAQTKKTPLGRDVDLGIIAREGKCEGFSGADLFALVREAAVFALREVFYKKELTSNNNEIIIDSLPSSSSSTSTPIESEESLASAAAAAATLYSQKLTMEVLVTQDHFRQALQKVSPSVSVAQRKRFEVLRAKFAGQPVGRGKEGKEGEKESCLT